MNKYERDKLSFLISLFTVLLFLFCLLILFGCSTTELQDVKKQSEETYKKDMKVLIDGIEYKGTGVLPIKNNYKITLNPSAKSERIIIQNCHRDMTVDRPKTGWFTNKYSFEFSPLDGVEKGKLCQLEIAAINDKRKNSFAFFEFDDSREEVSLQGFLRCSGQYSVSRAGVSLCQSAAGLEQEIFFQEKVVNEGVSEECNKPYSNDGFYWYFIPNKSKCSYYFVSNKKAKNGKRLIHRLTSIGYSTVPYPSEE